jgi:hypothetical protein
VAVRVMAVAASAAALEQQRVAEAEHGPSQRAFRLCVDARSFRAKKLPIAVAKIYVKLKLPLPSAHELTPVCLPRAVCVLALQMAFSLSSHSQQLEPPVGASPNGSDVPSTPACGR